MNYGEKISYLRKSKGMTQEELGRVLSVTYQAVSKWERGESLPDFSTMSQIAKYFGVPLEYFEDGVESLSDIKRSDGSLSSDSDIVGMCTVCGKVIKSDDEHTTSPKVMCKNCKEQHDKEIERKRLAEQEENKRKADMNKVEAARRIREQRGGGIDAKLIISSVIALIAYISLTVTCFVDKTDDAEMLAAFLVLVPLAAFAIPFVIIDFIAELRDRDDGTEGYTRNISLIVGGIFAAVNIAVFLVLYFALKQNGFFLALLGIGAVVSFTFISQFMWGSVVREIFTCGGFTFKLPGIIFALTPESIIMMIILKVVLGILSVLVFIVTTIFFAAVAILGSVFTFIPCIISKTFKDKSVAKENAI